MAIETIASSGTATQARDLGLEDFLRILLTQLNFQDPLKPMDNQAFMAQMAQFTALEQAQRSNEKLDQLVGNQAALQSVGLLGRAVEVRTDAGTVSGTVSALSFQGDSPALAVTTSAGTVLQDVALGRILGVH